MSPSLLNDQREQGQPRAGRGGLPVPPGRARLGWRLLFISLVVGLMAPFSWAKPQAPVGLTAISFSESGPKTVIVLKTTARPRFTAYKLEQPPRLTVDLTGCRLEGVESLLDVQTRAVDQIATTEFKAGRVGVARVMINFKQAARYAVRAERRSLVVTVTPGQEPATKSDQGSGSAGAAPGKKEGSKALLQRLRREAAAAREEAETARRQVAMVRGEAQGQAADPSRLIRNIRFVDGKERSRVEIVLEGEVRHRLRSGGSPVLELEGVVLPRLLQRTLDTTEFGGPVDRITSFLPLDAKGNAHIKVELNDRSAKHVVRREGRLLVWEFAKRQVAQKSEAPTGTSTRRLEETYDYQPSQVAAARTSGRRGGKRYSGRRIDLDFKDADIHNILRLLSDVGNVNVITSDQVQGRVTIRMRNVPWDQALDVILRAKGLGQVREANLIRVAPASDLEKEREAEIARLKQVTMLKPLETRLIPLSYAQASEVLPQLQYTLSPRGKLTFDARTNMVIARDIAGNLNLMERLIRNLDTQTPQVLIEARVVEARTNFSKELGIQWGGNFVSSQATGNATGLVFPSQIGIGGGVDDPGAPTGGILLGQDVNPGFVVNMPAATGLRSGSALGLTLGSMSGTVNINLRLSAAESIGDIRIVSAPRITTLDNVEARIEQGVTIPFSQVSASGVQTTFRDAKLNLTVKPHVTADGSVVMKVNVTRNEPDFVNTGPRGEPTILMKQAQTEMLVKDGDTAVIGGIYTTRTGRSYNKVPWFADIPILGILFKQRKDTSDREEVLVFITPRIINRAQSIGR